MITLEEANSYADRVDFCEYCGQEAQLSCGGCLYLNFITLSRRLIKNQLKYRWHDLRINPNDLPGEGTLIETVYVPAHLPIRTINYRYGHEYGGEGFNKRTDAIVIAWRGVEPFKAEEKEKKKC